MRSFLTPLSLLCLLCPEPASAQACVPLPGTGQAGFAIAPPCAGLVAPAVLYAAGSPGFTIAALAPLPPLAGDLMLLAVGLSVPPIPIPAPPLFPPLGLGFLGASPILLVAFAGLAGPVPLPVAIPLPPTGGPLGMFLTAHTVVLVPGGTIALSMGTGVII